MRYLLAAAAAVVCAPASAVTITFDSPIEIRFAMPPLEWDFRIDGYEFKATGLPDAGELDLEPTFVGRFAVFGFTTAAINGTPTVLSFDLRGSAPVEVSYAGLDAFSITPTATFQTFTVSRPGFFRLVSTSAFTVDNIVIADVAPVPEPATWAMMLLGFGAIGAAARYRPVRSARSG